jgi:hypothetical protein
VLGVWVGLRPARPSILLQLDSLQGRPLIHKYATTLFGFIVFFFIILLFILESNLSSYGHGGSGVTLSWGSALSVLRIAEKYFAPSKL